MYELRLVIHTRLGLTSGVARKEDLNYSVIQSLRHSLINALTAGFIVPPLQICEFLNDAIKAENYSKKPERSCS